MKRLAVVVFNLGGPDHPEAVKPFLFNLFNDPAIIGAPKLVRWLLAKFISSRRAPVAREIYEHLGGKSPLLEQTRNQANALEGALADMADTVKVFVAMRYWHPMTAETVCAVKDFAPDQIVLLPLYPQYSSTTSGSSLKLWTEEALKQELDVPTSTLCCYPDEAGLIDALALKIRDTLSQLSTNVRVLFSAHGLPKKVIAAGDPYQDQVEQTCHALVECLGLLGVDTANLDWTICYQSRVGPLEWIGPSTDNEIIRAGRDGVAVVMVPVAFVSEHSETLVELDIEYGALARESGVPSYDRIMTVQCNPRFISGLADQVRKTLLIPGQLRSCHDRKLCRDDKIRCPHASDRMTKDKADVCIDACGV
ncbi:ferrochelatase [Haematospirillum sp. H1815]|uniref:ferrochelatase n=1 Tax=Haematospirillum sp. H1815 TaxID=2723108 RepID=UPI00143A77A1|nr:ferrochelatase [Haematospirillum sp. H1815]NKD77082.1 ferrochelatase [Haematospirillum sp. H1815]